MIPGPDLLFESPPVLTDGGRDPGNNQFPLLLPPFAIGSAELRKRFVFQPQMDGTLSDAHAAYHEERARGGAATIVFESQAMIAGHSGIAPPAPS